MVQALEKPDAAQFQQCFNTLKSGFENFRNEPLTARKNNLDKLRKWIHENRALIHKAVYADFGKPSAEVDGTEIFHVLSEIRLALDSLDQWAKPRKVDAPWTMLGSRSHIEYEPKGVCLIISPWNYPFSLAVGPLVSAIAAGNTVLLKPSELTPHVSTLLDKMVNEVFDNNKVALMQGGPEVSEQLLTLPFDHIFFTGSPAVGKLVMKAAAENLTSVTLELGGKSPAIVAESARLQEAAKRISVTKFINNGQTCIAPDYVLVHERIAPAFLREIIHQTSKLFSTDGDFEKSPSYGRIVNPKHFSRLQALVHDCVSLGGKIEFGGVANRDSKFIHPIILSDVPLNTRIMTEEIFGPVLPIITYRRLQDAIEVVQQRPKPLALYIFSRNRNEQDEVLKQTSSGAVCVNDCAIHFLHHNLPFGGVNNSGMGKSHGYSGFTAFSNEKPVLKQKRGFTSVEIFYPPYTTFKQKLMNWFLKLF